MAVGRADYCNWHVSQTARRRTRTPMPPLQDGRISLEALRAWAAEFDRVGHAAELWPARDFVAWLEPEAAATAASR